MLITAASSSSVAAQQISNRIFYIPTLIAGAGLSVAYAQERPDRIFYSPTTISEPDQQFLGWVQKAQPWKFRIGSYSPVSRASGLGVISIDYEIGFTPCCVK